MSTCGAIKLTCLGSFKYIPPRVLEIQREIWKRPCSLQTCNSVVNMFMMGLELRQTLKITSTTGFLKYLPFMGLPLLVFIHKPILFTNITACQVIEPYLCAKR